jgi:hypothetical protein
MNKDNTLIIFDWDDTLFPSSEIITELDHNHKIVFNMDFDKDVYENNKKNFNKELINLLTYVKTLGMVIIVTSSRNNWVLISASQFLSEEAVNLLKTCEIFYVNEVLTQNNITSIAYENEKSAVFDLIINEFINIINNKIQMTDIINPFNIIFKDKKNNIINVISLGDGFQEANAYFYITKKNELNYYNNIEIIYKHIAYKKRPTYGELLKEYKLIKEFINIIINNNITTYYQLYFNIYNMCIFTTKELYSKAYKIYSKPDKYQFIF